MSVVQKLLIRELNGSLSQKYSKCRKPKMYEKCPEHLQISLQEVISQNNLLLGHVITDFSRDGRHILSYQCKIIDEIDVGCPYLGYNYFLHWWEFHYKMPAKRVQAIPLFVGENICNELHLLICQPPSGKHIIVHGSSSISKSSMLFGPASRSLQSTTCYLSVAPTPDASRTKNNVQKDPPSRRSYALHLKYELVPPHPPFFPSVNLKFDDLVLINSGDFLCAFSAYVQFDELVHKEEFPAFTSMLCPLNCASNCFCGYLSHSVNLRCQCSSPKSPAFSTNDIENGHEVNCKFIGANSIRQNDLPEFFVQDNVARTSKSNSDSLDGCTQCPDSTGATESTSQLPGNRVSSAHTSCYVHFFCHGASDLSSNYNTPFDYASTAFPITVTDERGRILPLTFSHCCSSDSASSDLPYEVGKTADVIVKQLLFDAEQFLGEKLRSLDFKNKEFVSLKDYDMQLVQVCRWTRTVIILVKVLIQLSDKIDESSASPRLATYVTGFLLTWNIQSGAISVLEEQSLVEFKQQSCKSQSVCHGLEQVVQLRRKNFQPSNYQDSVLSFSNHSVFSGRSMRYLLHPFQPLAMVL